LQIKVRHTTYLKSSDRIVINFNASDLFLFDAQTGNRIA